MTNDPLIETARQARVEISEACGNDVYELGKYLRAFERRMRESGRHGFLPVAASDYGTKTAPELALNDRATEQND